MRQNKHVSIYRISVHMRCTHTHTHPNNAEEVNTQKQKREYQQQQNIKQYNLCDIVVTNEYFSCFVFYFLSSTFHITRTTLIFPNRLPMCEMYSFAQQRQPMKSRLVIFRLLLFKTYNNKIKGEHIKLTNQNCAFIKWILLSLFNLEKLFR